MKKVDLFKQVETLEDLENLEIGTLHYEISHRGGHLGFYLSDVASYLGIENLNGAGKFGAWVNYLGGGIRGSIQTAWIDPSVEGENAEALQELAQACKRVYLFVEDEIGLNDEEYDDGDTNWDALATKNARDAGIESAY